MFLGTHADKSSQGPPPVEMLARFAFVMALASLVGAFAGSKRSLAGAAQTPWGAYVIAGLIAVFLFVAINVMIDLVKQANTAIVSNPTVVTQETVAPAAAAHINDPPAYQPLPVRRRLPWSVLPFFLVLALCRLARLEYWPGLPRTGQFGRIAERLADGAALSMTMMFAFYLAIGIYQAFGISLPPRLQESLDMRGMFAIAFSSPLLVFGFLIGFFVARDIRRAAHARIIAAPARQEKVELIPPPSKPLVSRA
jgi:hypothetical protein